MTKQKQNEKKKNIHINKYDPTKRQRFTCARTRVNDDYYLRTETTLYTYNTTGGSQPCCVRPGIIYRRDGVVFHIYVCVYVYVFVCMYVCMYIILQEKQNK